eukprot:3785000-Karenia_brevis.AAC.1
MLGPTASDHQWTAAVSSWVTAAAQLAVCHFPASLMAHIYNSKVVSRLSYLVAFLEPPKYVYTKERAVLHKILKIPPNSFSSGDLFNFPEFGGPQFRSIRVMAASAK